MFGVSAEKEGKSWPAKRASVPGAICMVGTKLGSNFENIKFLVCQSASVRCASNTSDEQLDEVIEQLQLDTSGCIVNKK